MSVDESSFTGETEPVSKITAVLTDSPSNGVSHSENLAFMGTLVRQGSGKVRHIQAHGKAHSGTSRHIRGARFSAAAIAASFSGLLTMYTCVHINHLVFFH